MSRKLSARENEIVELVSRGESNAAIAAKLGISEETVKRHLDNIFEKTSVRNRTELAGRGKVTLLTALGAMDQLSALGTSGAQPVRWYRPSERKPPSNVAFRLLVRPYEDGSIHEIVAFYIDGKFSVQIEEAYEGLKSQVLAWCALPSASRSIRPGYRKLPTVDEVRAMLVRCNGNKQRAAGMLGISRSTLYQWIEKAEASDDRA